VIEVDLKAAAYEHLRGWLTPKSRKSGVYRVMMPKGLAAHLDASRASGEGISEVILRLAKEAKGRTRPRAPR